MTAQISGKRNDRNSIGESNPEVKKSRIEQPTISSLAHIIFHTDHQKARKNLACMNAQLFNRFFNDNDNNKSNVYVKIDNFVIKAKSDSSLSPQQVDVSIVVYNDIRKNLQSLDNQQFMRISPFFSDKEKVVQIESILFKVYPLDRRWCKNKFRVIKKPFEEWVMTSLSKHILTLQQSFCIYYPRAGALRVKPERWIPEKAGYGCLTNNTKISFISAAENELILAEEFDPRRIKQVIFVIKNVTSVTEYIYSTRQKREQDAWKEGIQPLPLPLPYDEVTQKIRQYCADMQLEIGSSIKLPFGKNWNYEVVLDKVEVLPLEESDNETLETSDEYRENNLKLFSLVGSSFNLQAPNIGEVLLTEQRENAKPAKELKFEVIDFYSDSSLKKNEVAWVNLQDLIREILLSKKVIAENEKISVDFNQRKYLLVLKEAIGEERIEQNMNLQHVWALDNNAEIKIFPKPSLQLKIVDTPNPLPLISIKVKVSVVKQFTFRENFDAAQNDNEEKVLLEDEELEKIFKQSIPSDCILHENQTIKGISGSGHDIEFKLKQFSTREKKVKTYNGSSIYLFLPETTLKFEENKESCLIISSKRNELNFENIYEKLIELGIGGMSNKVKKTLTEMVLSRTSFSEHLEQLGQKPSRGLLLYGPPGTGKTLLARKFGELFGIPGERIQSYTGSEFWKKYLGESEKAIQNIFLPAREEQKRFGKESRLHLIIIDEVEACLPKRALADKRYEKSVVDAFLAAFDGISSQGEEPLDNIIVIGLTNNPEQIDDAAKRPGRLFPHLHITLPDKKGRREIFDIHTKLIKEKGFLADDVNI
ncbi:MAG TPA: AAA family ATPase, partial [Waddliaceae bacterium]